MHIVRLNAGYPTRPRLRSQSMNNTDFNQLLATPLSMIRERRHDSAAQVAYMSRWRNRTAA